MHSLAITLLALSTAYSTSASLLLPRNSIPLPPASCEKNPGSKHCQTEEFSYVFRVCLPKHNGKPDLTAPCNAAVVINNQCVFGEDKFEVDLTATQLSNATQRQCICESQFWDQNVGCAACIKAHGGENLFADAGLVGESMIQSMSSSYCAASATPTLAFAEFQNNYDKHNSAIQSAVSEATKAAKTSPFTDSIGNKTQVSLYFTPAVTGSQAWEVGKVTEKGATTSSHVVSGQIVPTLGEQRATTTSAGNGAGTGTGTGTAASTTSTGSNGADKKEAAAVAGVIGLAGLVALL